MTESETKSDCQQGVRFLRHQLYWLYWTWNYYKGLFSSETNFELMIRTTGGLARAIRVSMLDSIQLNICALTDQASSGKGNTNLSLYSLLHWCSPTDETSDRRQLLKERLDEAKKESGRIRKRRNKLIAHYDSPAILQEDPELIEWPTNDEIEGSVELLIEVMKLGEQLLGEYLSEFFEDDWFTGAQVLLDQLTVIDKRNH